MKKYIIPALVATTAVSGVYAETVQDQINELKKQVEELQYKSYENIFTFSGRMENIYQHLTVQDKKAGQEGTANYDYLSTLFQLNMTAIPSDRMSFYGRLSMSKYWNDINPQGDEPNISTGNGRNYSGAGVFVERAFINYNIRNNLTFSIGRLPTVDGTPKHYASADTVMGTYPALSYAAILDGMALTHAASLMGGTFTTRLIYTPFTTVNLGSETSSSELTNSAGDKMNSHSPMITLMGDYEKYNMSVAERMHIVGQAVRLQGVEVGDPTGQQIVAGTTIYDVQNSDLNFDITKLLLAAEANGIFKTKFDFAAQVAWSQVKSEGKITARALTDTSGTINATSIPIGGVFTDSDSATSEGWAYLASLRYSFTNDFKVGYEWSHTTSKAFVNDFTSNLANDFYGSKGTDGHHVYMNYKFDGNLKMVLGYMYQQRDVEYTQDFFGAGTSMDKQIHTFYTNLIATF